MSYWPKEIELKESDPLFPPPAISEGSGLAVLMRTLRRRRFRREVQQLSSSDQRSFEKKFLGNRLERRSRHLYRSTLRIATHRTATAASDSRTEPFLHGSARDPNAVGLRGIGFE